MTAKPAASETWNYSFNKQPIYKQLALGTELVKQPLEKNHL